MIHALAGNFIVVILIGVYAGVTSHTGHSIWALIVGVAR
jgi:hypothetical protein